MSFALLDEQQPTPNGNLGSMLCVDNFAVGLNDATFNSWLANLANLPAGTTTTWWVE